MTTNMYEIGGLRVEMTAAAAGRWNCGDTTDSDLDASRVDVSDGRGTRTITLRRATNVRLERECATQMRNSPANLISESA